MVLERVNKLKYLGYTLSSNNENKLHVKKQVEKSRSILGKIYGIGRRYFKDNWEKRRLIFEAMCKSIAFYGIEVWGYEKFEEVERLTRNTANGCSV